MADTISFDKAVYDPGERMTISYECAPREFRGVRLKDVNGVVLLNIRSVTGKGVQVYTLREDAPAGMYKAELTYYRGMGVKAYATAEVTGVGVPPAEKGYLKVNTSPTGASVTVGGVSCGTTPVIACELSAGAKTVTITKSGYNTVTKTVTIVAGQTSDLGTITLTPTGAPPVDGGITKELELGEYEVTWTLSDHDTLKAEIKVTDTGVICLLVVGGACDSSTPPGVVVSAFTVTGYLKSAVAEKGYLKVNTSPTGASVTVGGVSCGTTPVIACELSAGAKTVTIAKSGYDSVTRYVTITAGQTSDLGTITLTETGVLPTKMTKSDFIAEIQNRGKIDLTKISTTSGWNKWYKSGYRISYSDGVKYLIDISNIVIRNPPTRETDIHFSDVSGATPTDVAQIDRTWAIAALDKLPFVGAPTGFDDWVDSKGGKDAIKGSDIGELVDAFIGLGDVGFTVTGANVNKVTDYYLGLG